MCVYIDEFLKKFLVLIQDKRCRNLESVSWFLKREGQADSGSGVTIGDCVSHVFMQQALWIPKPGAAPMRLLLHEGEALETTRDSCTASLTLMPSLQLQQKTGPGPVGTLDGVATLLPNGDTTGVWGPHQGPSQRPLLILIRNQHGPPRSAGVWGTADPDLHSLTEKDTRSPCKEAVVMTQHSHLVPSLI